MKFDPADPLKMEFIIDTADQKDVSEEEASRLIRYFLAGLTIPEEDIWVNMSPYEADKMIPANLSETDLGKDLLSQDYILKQLSSSLTYPESDTGKDFWAKAYQEVLKVAKTTKLPVNTFNKIWITPDKAVVYENNNIAMVSEATLKTILEEDYLALKQGLSPAGTVPVLQQQINQASSKVMRETILPKINQDVNSGKNFATLRQIYYSLILGVWFKKKFKESIYKAYINQGKVKGIDITDKDAKDKIYNLYVEAFKKGIYNYIKPEKDLGTGRNIKRQYFSGGFTVLGVSENAVIKRVPEIAMSVLGKSGNRRVQIVASPLNGEPTDAPADPNAAGNQQAGSPMDDGMPVSGLAGKRVDLVASPATPEELTKTIWPERDEIEFMLESELFTIAGIVKYVRNNNDDAAKINLNKYLEDVISRFMDEIESMFEKYGETKKYYGISYLKIININPNKTIVLEDEFSKIRNYDIRRQNFTHDLPGFSKALKVVFETSLFTKAVYIDKTRDNYIFHAEEEIKELFGITGDTGKTVATSPMLDERVNPRTGAQANPKGGIDMAEIDVEAREAPRPIGRPGVPPSAGTVSIPAIDLENFQGLTFRIIKIESIVDMQSIFGSLKLVEAESAKQPA